MQQNKMSMDLNEVQAVRLAPQFISLETATFEMQSGFDIAKRTADIVCSAAILAFSSPLLLLIAIVVRLSSPGPAIFWSRRRGRHNLPFMMPKFRTMYCETPEVPSVELGSARSCITPVGRILRQTSLDELPQLWSVLIGDMSLIGPRPAICAEVELAERRASLGVEKLAPGITGWAQVNGRDGVGVEQKALLDHYYLRHRSIQMDLRILIATIICVLSREGILH
jgi:O-antigen biosynthesis protein WbqP